MLKPYFTPLPLLAFVGLANAQEAAEATDIPDLPVLRMFEQQGLTIRGKMDLPGGLEAYAATGGGQALPIFILPDSNYAIVGTLVDAQGRNVAASALEELTKTPIDPAAWEKLAESGWVQDGNPDAPRVVYTFTDPNCPFCNRFWQASRPWVESGKVQLRHVMVGVIKADSRGKAAAILEATSPEEALTENETNHGDGGIAALVSPAPETSEKLNQNERLMSELGFSGTPGILFQNEDGSISTVSGMPQGPELERTMGPR